MSPRLPDLAIVGPSATGKTALAAALADDAGDVELVSVDALAVYRGMDIGTAKPSRPGDPASRHRWGLVDLRDPAEEFSVAEFQGEARAFRTAAHDAMRSVVFVGGTGLYHRAVVDDLNLPGRFPDVASELEAEADAPGGLTLLHERLAELDPVAAGRMEPTNRRRVVRALEVTVGTGRRFSEFGPGLEVYPPGRALTIGLRLSRPRLAARLAERLRAQMSEGFLDEVRRLASAPRPMSRTAGQGIGYRELLAHLAGELELTEALSTIDTRLRSFAKRQESWFRRDPRVRWFDAEDPALTRSVRAFWETGPQ